MERKMDISGIANRELANDDCNSVSVKEILRLLYCLEMSVANANHDQINHEECWNYIPFSHIMFLEKLRLVKTKKSFLEVGCGLGVKLYLARKLCGVEDVQGIEINPLYASIASQLIDGKIHNMDAREFTDYDQFDVIYAYSPLRWKYWIPLKERIKKEMRDDAVFIDAKFGMGIGTFTKGQLPCE